MRPADEVNGGDEGSPKRALAVKLAPFPVVPHGGKSALSALNTPPCLHGVRTASRTMPTPSPADGEWVGTQPVRSTAWSSTATDGDDIVVGAGVYGAAVAWELARAGRDVLVLEADTVAS